MAETLVVALGGNAILQPRQRGTYAEQRRSVGVTAKLIARLIRRGYRVVITHGNGPQVGNLLIQNERAAGEVPPMPLDVCDAESQGFIGYMLQQALGNELAFAQPVVSLVTQVTVDAGDPAFAEPTKPIGPFYTAAEAARLQREKGYVMREDAGRGWRRVVPSPVPRGIVEIEAIRTLVDSGAVVIAGGGGGIPVIRRGGVLVGVEAVIDKDLLAELLAREVGASRLIILTDVPRVLVHYRQPEERPLTTVTCSELEAYLAAGHFPPGSMAPKIRAAIGFVRGGGQEAIITSLTGLDPRLSPQVGTHVVPDEERK